MEKFKLLNRIQELYLQNQNIIQYLKSISGSNTNTTEDILISYDFQAGNYSKSYRKNIEFKTKHGACLADAINKLGSFNSILEAGTGEATTLASLLPFLKKEPAKKYGFDISWSRIKYARKLVEDMGIGNVELFTGDLFCSPLKDGCADIVFTSHAIEPNGGREREALTELYRIAGKYLVLLEPSYELASEEARQRMKEHGYITKLYSTAVELGYKIIEHRLFEASWNPLNPTGLMIIEKGMNVDEGGSLCCPITKTAIEKVNNAYFSKESLLAYPILDGIPCLLPDNAIVATHFLD